jgi:hypothetical protein
VRRAGFQYCARLQRTKRFGARVADAALQGSRWARREALPQQPAMLMSPRGWLRPLLRRRRARAHPPEETRTRGWLRLRLALRLPGHGEREPRG